MDEEEWGTTADEEVSANGFATFDEGDTSGFAIRPVDIRQHSKDDIAALAVGTRSIVLATTKRQLLRRRLERTEDFAVLPVPYKGAVGKAALYTDLYGYHCIFYISPKAIFYLNYQSDTVLPLTKILGIEVTSMAFSPEAQASNSGQILIGGADGSIYTYRIEQTAEGDPTGEQLSEEDPVSVYQLPYSPAVYGLVYDTYTVTDEKGGSSLSTLALAVTNDTCYQFVGAAKLQAVFERYRQSPGELEKYKKHLPQDTLKQSELKTYYRHSPEEGFELASFVWKSGAGACYGRFRRKDDFKEPVAVKIFEVDPYQKQLSGTGIPEETPLPQAIAINDYNVFMLYMDNLTVSSIENKQIEFSEDFRAMDKMSGMAYEPVSKAIWMFSSKNLYRMIIGDADKELWKQQMSSGKFSQALESCREADSKYAPHVAGVYADSEFAAGRTLRAGELYAISNRSFEEVTTKYLSLPSAQDKGGLECYLMKKLEQYGERREKLVQRVLLCSWVLQLKLARLSKLRTIVAEPIEEDANEEDNSEEEKKRREGERKEKAGEKEQQQAQYKKLELEFRKFLLDHEASMESDTVFQLLQNHGRLEDCLLFAEQKVSSGC